MSKEDARILLPGLGTYPAWTGVALLEAIGHGAGQQEYVYDAGLNDSGYDWKQYCRICPELQRQQDASAIG